MILHVVPLDLPGLGVGEAARRLAHRERVTAWAGDWSTGGLVTCDPVPGDLFPALPAVAPDPAHPDAVGGGWFGHRGFDGTDSWASYRDVLRFDGTAWFHEALLDGAFDAAAARRRAAELAADLRRPARTVPARLEVTAFPDRTAHVVAVERCVQAIRRGEIYQANIACHVHGRLHGSPHDAWARLVEAHAPARAALVADPGRTAVGASPELFLRRRGRTVETSPIKGTRPRTGGPDDAAERQRLAASTKDAAENVMIVDLMRNDLARVCSDVTVPRLLEIEPHPGVWHLVSTVRGTLDTDDAGLLAATFPPGSVTGTPKIRAVELIGELEAEPRGLFTGMLGYLSPLAGVELAVAIRTLEVAADGTARLGVGGGVTVDSTPVQEWAECRTKAAPLLAALGAAPWPPDPAPSRLADPAAGLFETLLAVDGRPRRVAEHVRRLQTSFAECHGRPLDADVAAAMTTGPPGPARVRVDASPDSRLAVRAAPFVPVPLAAQPGLDLVVHRLGPAGAPRHKSADRDWTATVEAPLGPDQAALLVDDRDVVLESTRSGVAVVLGGRVTVPPLDGRILPGTARRALLDVLDTAELPYDLRAPALGELAGADGMFLLNALRGVQWVRSVPGRTWTAPDPVTVRAAQLLDADRG
ncbi:bifunctional chorismate-binding protein/class IV aminotransferase [Pseudonocardia abyssalis]|uniref:Chorismate-binding protein n=1 Tax=Pseudonocardia abyssalis TaxID=2792008 RepID=A0ABS6UQK3_9PSEU|nr:bifunctional chorismate-binding protein/class IV aminotransferase [Pseudonocardia abyssalis]MBW0115552.1 chorismate-binding protein [Pseudonocardia abyssalis]MBW0134509.1 chorismate-binding protein [Pseudonocardia abyssalis]